MQMKFLLLLTFCWVCVFRVVSCNGLANVDTTLEVVGKVAKMFHTTKSHTEELVYVSKENGYEKLIYYEIMGKVIGTSKQRADLVISKELEGHFGKEKASYIKYIIEDCEEWTDYEPSFSFASPSGTKSLVYFDFKKRTDGLYNVAFVKINVSFDLAFDEFVVSTLTSKSNIVKSKTTQTLEFRKVRPSLSNEQLKFLMGPFFNGGMALAGSNQLELSSNV